LPRFKAARVGMLNEARRSRDAAVFDAYGWPHDLTDEQILERPWR
jgi:hypothetical protein